MKVYYFYSSHEMQIKKRLGTIIAASAFDIIELGDSDFELYRLPRKRITRNIITKCMDYHRLSEDVLNELLKMEKNYRAYEI